MRPIRVVYWNSTVNNYGDLLSPYIIQGLTGCEIIKKNYFVGNSNSHLYQIFKSLINFDINLNTNYLFPFEKPIIAIGSILSHGNSHSKIWGSGFMSKDERCNGGKIYAIRGYKSLSIIQEQIKKGDSIKLNKNYTVGDPALLLPLLVNPSLKKKYKISIIPHFSEIEYFKKQYSQRYNIIDLRTENIEDTTKSITSSQVILSTSLHGIIVAHAYGIPAIWMELTGLEQNTNGFKFYDYFSSIGISNYSPVRNIDQILSNDKSIELTFKYYKDVSLPPKMLVREIQSNLLACAPFKITDSIKKKILQ